MDSAYMGASDCADSDVDDALALSGLYSEIPSEDQKFYFHDITIEGRTITFSYSFCKQTRFDSIVVLDEPVSADYMPVLFAMGMCVCSWYWMGFYTSEVVICADVCVKCRVSLDMMPFWAELYHQTSLEFVHVNNIAYKEVSFVLEAPLEPAEISSPKRINFDRNAPNYSVLIPMGGGKDSLVVWHEHKWKGESRSNSPFSKKQKVRGATTLPSLTGRWSPTLPFMSLLKPPPAQPLLLYVADGLDEFHSSKRLQEMIRLTGDKVTLVRHEFHNDTIYLKKRSYLRPCAHPWAALVLFDSILVAKQAGIKEVSFGYERSADEGNGVYVNGCEVNHQYDKSSAFLAQAQAYISRFIDPTMEVKSILHGMWELQIAKIFCESPQLQPFLPVFLSCNDPLEGDWCRRCDKCAFIFLLLSAWLPPPTVVHTVFGGVNMLNDVSLLGVFEQLVGLAGCKPFDCVGTVAEACAALHMTAAQYKKQITSLPPDAVVYGNNFSSDNMCGTEEEKARHRRKDTHQLPVVLCELCARLHIEVGTGDDVFADNYTDSIMRRWGVDH